MVKRKKPSKKQNSFTENQKERMQEITDTCKIQMHEQLRELQRKSDALVAQLTHEMNSTIANLPNEIAEMTVEEYIAQYLKQFPQVEEDKVEPVLSDVSNKTVQPKKSDKPDHREDVDHVIEDLISNNPVRKSKRKVPPSATTSRSKRLNSRTPASLHPPFRSIEGTPLFSRKGISSNHLNLSETPRAMQACDSVTAFEFKMFSDRGSPMVASEQMKEKIQESIHKLMQEMQE